MALWISVAPVAVLTRFGPASTACSSPGASSVASGNNADDLLSQAGGASDEEEAWSEAEQDAWDEEEERPEDGGDVDFADMDDEPDAHTQSSMRADESNRAGSDQAEADARLESELQGGLDAARRD